jgi:glutamate 5-kinase
MISADEKNIGQKLNPNRVVIKIGTRILDSDKVVFNTTRIKSIVSEIAQLHNAGKEVLIVSSGAVGAGMRELNMDRRPQNIPELQALAAIGQGKLIHMYNQEFAKYNIKVAQLLLSRADVNDRRRYLNIRYTLLELLKFRVIPIINENDTVTIEELKFGDNDNLSALIASKIDADLLIIMTDVDGLYSCDPKKVKDAKCIPVVEKITDEIKGMAKGVQAELTVGGMITKISAADIATKSGIYTIIANGLKEQTITKIMSGEEVGTLFLPVKSKKMSMKKRYLLLSKVMLNKKIVVDDGAKNALIKNNKSLLPIGVVDVIGEFLRGTIVEIVDKDNNVIGKGLVNYSSEEIKKIKRKKTAEITGILGSKPYDEVIHKDNLVL